MDNFIFEPSKHKNKTILKNEYFTIHGYEDFFDDTGYPRVESEDSINILAKKVFRIDGTVKHMIKIYPDGKMYNPTSIYDDNKSYKNSTKFREVNYKSFNMYLSFLKTKNTSWLYNAEREAE